MRSDEQTPPTLDTIIGRNLRRLREAAGKSQDELSRELRARDLHWTRPTVTAVELGTKTIDVAELVLLSLALDVPVDELVAGDAKDRVRLSADRYPLPLGVVRAVLKGDLEKLTDEDAGYPEMDLEWFNARKRRRKELAPGTTVQLTASVTASSSVTATPHMVVQAERASEGDAERKAARKLHVDPVDLSVAAFRLWNRSLSDERDARVATRVTADASLRTVQATRGHTTRALLEELAPHLKKEN